MTRPSLTTATHSSGEPLPEPIRTIRKTVESLRDYPERGTPVYEAPGEPLYRYLQSGNYLIFYTVSDRTAYIDRVLYAHRDYLAILFGIDSLEDDS